MLHFIIGDIHGCLDELLHLEEKVRRVAEKRKQQIKIVSVGDLIDRGPSSKEVVQHFLNGEISGSHLAVMGNHESSFLNYLRNEHSTWFQKNNLKVPKYMYSLSEVYKSSRWSKGFTSKEYSVLVKGMWLAQGGIETLESYGVNVQRPSYKNLAPEHIKYLGQLPLFYETRTFIVTHALPKKSDFNSVKKYIGRKSSLNSDVKKSCNNIYWNREKSGVKKIGEKILISGHTPYKIPRRSLEGKVVQIDTHCYAGGKLTTYCPELDCYFSVKAGRKYYGLLG